MKAPWRNKLLAALLAAGITGGYLYFNQDPPIEAKQSGPVLRSVGTPVSPKLRLNNQDNVSELLDKGPQAVAVDKMADYLSLNTNSPAAWGAVFDLSGDQALLRKALEKFPGDHRLLLRAIVSLEPPTEREPYIREFSQKFPDESIGDYTSAFIKFQSGDNQGALDLMRAAILKKAPVVFDNEDALSRKAALEQMGLPEKEAALRIFSVPVDLNQQNGLRKLLPSLLSSGASADVIGEIGLAYCVHVRQTQSKSGTVDHQATAFEEAFLRNLPPDVEYGSTGQTVAERLQSVQVANEETTSVLLRVKELWLTATPEEVKTWSDSALAGGEIFAYKRWVEAKKQASQGR